MTSALAHPKLIAEKRNHVPSIRGQSEDLRDGVYHQIQVDRKNTPATLNVGWNNKTGFFQCKRAQVFHAPAFWQQNTASISVSQRGEPRCSESGTKAHAATICQFSTETETADLIHLGDSVAETRRPPSRWRNRWVAQVQVKLFCAVCDHRSLFEPGDLLENHCLTFPSRDLAETWAQERTPEGVLYLGPFSLEGEGS